MNLKKNLVQPIILGAVMIVVVLLCQWVLAAVGFSPVIAVQFLGYALTGPGVVGTVVTAWAVGSIVPFAVKQAEGLAGKA